VITNIDLGEAGTGIFVITGSRYLSGTGIYTNDLMQIPPHQMPCMTSVAHFCTCPSISCEVVPIVDHIRCLVEKTKAHIFVGLFLLYHVCQYIHYIVHRQQILPSSFSSTFSSAAAAPPVAAPPAAPPPPAPPLGTEASLEEPSAINYSRCEPPIVVAPTNTLVIPR
jgi:hypothetical protein